MKEIWKPVAGYEGYYEVSNIGNVRSVWSGKPVPMKTYVNEHGYCVLRLTKNGVSKIRNVHRLMLESFIGKDPDRPIVNHKDGNKLNNTLDNLEWTTSRENNIHAIKTGLKDPEAISRECHIQIDDLDFVAKSPKRAAKILHQHGYFADVSEYNLRAAIIRCCLSHSLYCGILRVEYTDDPYDIPKEYHKCGIKGRVICAKLPSGLTAKAKGPSKLAKHVQRLGYWQGHDHNKLVKMISEAALNNRKCYGIQVWYKYTFD